LKLRIRAHPRGAARLQTNCGQSLVEFALIAPLFFLLIFGILDFGRAFFVHLTLQHAVRQAGRFAVTGQQSTGGSREDSIKAAAQQAAVGLDIRTLTITSCCSTNSGSNLAGGPNDTITILMAVDLPLITPLIGKFFGDNGVYHFTVISTFRNEPFPL